MEKVLFACRHNAGRSKMAEALFGLLADPSKAVAASAGTEPGTEVNPQVVAALREVGIELASASPRLLTADLANAAALLVTMGCGEGCPYVPGLEVRDWALPDPDGRSLEEVRAIRDRVRAEVEALVLERSWGR